MGDLSRKDCLEAPGSSVGELPPGSAKLSSSPSAVGTLKRPTSLSRHASAAGFSLPAAPRAVPKGHKTPMSYSPMESGDGPFIDPEDISQLLTDVTRFADALEKLRDVVLRDDPKEPQRPLAHECLGEMLRILRQVINKYPLLNTLETLTAAGTLISKVKGFHYESNNEADKREFEKAVETIAVSFSSTVSEFLMGEVDSSTILSIPPSDQNQTMESLYGGIPGPGGDGVPSGMDSCDTGKQDESECRTNMPFLSIYLLALEQDMEHGTSVLQAANTLQQQTFLQPLMVRRLEHEKRRKEIKEQWHRAQRKLVSDWVCVPKNSVTPPLSSAPLQQCWVALLCWGPLAGAAHPLAGLHPHPGSPWQQEAEGNLRKAKQTYMQRSEEHDKAKYMAVKAEEEQQNTTSSITTKTLDKKRRLEEEAKNKAAPAGCAGAGPAGNWPLILQWMRQAVEYLRLGFLRLVGGSHGESFQVSFLPIHILFSPLGLPLLGHGRAASMPASSPRVQRGPGLAQREQQEPRSCQVGLEQPSEEAPNPISSFSQSSQFLPASRLLSSHSLPNAGSNPNGLCVLSAGGRGHQVHKSWPTSVAEADSSLDSSAGEFSHKLQRLSSNGTASSSEELEEKDGTTTPFEQSINGITPELAAPTGPFRNVGLSKAAQTHRLRKLRAPSKCRECNSYVYFQGAECEECYLACHKKCLETLAIQCGHKKLQGKLQLFGQDFTKASQGSPDGIPFIIKKCISEIEKRALKTKGIYRVNGVKTRVEKLCQAFENGKELVELSQASPHDISNVLKLYLRQLPEPLMPFRLYNELMGLAKESLQGGEAKGRGGKGGPELVDRGADTDQVVLSLVLKLRELLKELPCENMATLQYLLQHLRRIMEVEQDNKMTSGNLGIVFGPTLMRPRPTDATISLSSLVDYPHQARIIEALIIFYPTIFEHKDLAPASRRGSGATEEVASGAERAHGGSQPVTPLGTNPYLELPSEKSNLAFSADSLAESGDRSVDSDSELEDGGEPRTHLSKQGSETSTEEVHFYDEGSEGLRSRSCSMGQSDAEGSAPRCCSPGDEQSDVEEHPESRSPATPGNATNQPSTPRGHSSHELQPRLT
ncbi:hypothetical protein IHE44_0010020 [Lamprotornis superbus]|uniref:Minor histocompatibility protein HA-1 n=1 Tax=Lamprotornis superbus TaxID=245042 RepID=A0A835TQR3_9PASS|nr:hypothetical protein IHE44_0010020 [Lamprotornis superbus]